MYTKKEHIHFVGIGGIGMSGIAAILKHQGYTISGCDASIDQESVTYLQNNGCMVYYGNNSPQCADPTITILVYIQAYRTSISSINAEVNAAQMRGVPTVTRAQMLQELMRQKYSIGITGAHGKTTTTSLIAHMLTYAHLDPTALIGGYVKNFGANFRIGSGDFLVAEADESDRSFLDLYPTLAVITNIDLEHLETYRDLDDIKETFYTFTNNIPFYGTVIANGDDVHIRSLLPRISKKTVTYGLSDSAHFVASNIMITPYNATFTLLLHRTIIHERIIVPLPGLYNVYNTLAAIAAAYECGIQLHSIVEAITCFKSVDRRFSYRGTYRGAEIFDDYAHHPQEIASVLTVARKRAKKNLIVVFQPHRYTRTEKLWYEFILLFGNDTTINQLIITDIYGASEYPIRDLTSAHFVDPIKQLNRHCVITYIPSSNNFTFIKKQLHAAASPDDLIIFLGAGSIYKVAHELAQ